MGSQVDLTICDVRVTGFRVMTSKYPGYCVHSHRRFDAGQQIAFKRAKDLTPDQRQAIFGNKKVYNLTIMYPLDDATSNGKEIEATGKPEFTPNEQQKAIFDALIHSDDHLLVEALAGCAKSTTLQWLVWEMKERGLLENQQVIYLAFNKVIEREMQPKLHGTGVPAQTTHSFGFGVLKNCFNNDRMDAKNGLVAAHNFLRLICDDNGMAYTAKAYKEARKMPEYALRKPVLKGVGLAKNNAIIPEISANTGGWMFSDDDRALITRIVEEHIEFDTDEFSIEDVVAYIARVMIAGIPDSGDLVTEIDFDDMLWLTCLLMQRRGLKLPQYDLVLTDESQDFNRCQILMLEGLVHG